MKVTLNVRKTDNISWLNKLLPRSSSCFCTLILCIYLFKDGEGITVTIDRFDPGREVAGGSGKIPAASLPGDFVIPCTVNAWGPSSDIVVHGAEDISLAFQVGTSWQLLGLINNKLSSRQMTGLCTGLDFQVLSISNTAKLWLKQDDVVGYVK